MNPKLLTITLLTLVFVSCSKSKVVPDSTGTNNGGGSGTPSGGITESIYLTNAKAVRSYVQSAYATSFGSYRVNTTTNTSGAYEWYVASQLYADAEMVELGDASIKTSLTNTLSYLQKLIDKSDINGGYFAAASLDGSTANGGKYVDDNALTGMAFLAAYDVSSGSDKDAFLSAAKGCAKWLINSSQWDTNFGGGFWWSTDKTVKPTQSNGLALQLFSRLYKITGDAVYKNWATAVYTWLNAQMFDVNSGLYIWQIEKSGTKDTYKFSYDNAIMVEALLLYADVMGDGSYQVKAQALGNAMIATLWDKNFNVFIFNTNDQRVNPCYSGWASQAMIKLYEFDNNVNWLTYAKGNIDEINVVLKNPAVNGYYQYAALNGSGRYTNLEGVDQAWMQRIQALLSKYK
ncbi:glycoside hydrolase family 76 protein [Mucilaginibacter ginkgonis]|uniref:AGE family epimerase/isomerase n=1 Tax=Mucilaginibacter ginkgonis TaxID=2682091 RepID=A0A6I4HZL1_9SPHI|nr:glycoside hydrolase family 76 protein [Mucilaginibacter ginkgonis]QQL49985.1 AGE family epimerase/isomerase [Mucilaginibacter ginkgonis]